MFKYIAMSWQNPGFTASTFEFSSYNFKYHLSDIHYNIVVSLTNPSSSSGLLLYAFSIAPVKYLAHRITLI